MHISLLGSTGRLGTLIQELLIEKGIGFKALERSFLDSPESFKKYIDNLPTETILLDVSLPAGTKKLCQFIAQLNGTQRSKIKGIVIGTTGHSKEDLEVIARASENNPVCLVSNFSKGVFLFQELLKATTSLGISVSALAKELGFDLALNEVHHTRKLDAPSGTAVTLAEDAHIPLSKVSSLRVGSVVGEHTIYISQNSELLTIKHEANSRKLFAEGALELCKNIYKNSPKPGFIRKEEHIVPSHSKD